MKRALKTNKKNKKKTIIIIKKSKSINRRNKSEKLRINISGS